MNFSFCLHPWPFAVVIHHAQFVISCYAMLPLTPNQEALFTSENIHTEYAQWIPLTGNKFLNETAFLLNNSRIARPPHTLLIIFPYYFLIFQKINDSFLEDQRSNHLWLKKKKKCTKTAVKAILGYGVETSNINFLEPNTEYILDRKKQRFPCVIHSADKAKCTSHKVHSELQPWVKIQMC